MFENERRHCMTPLVALSGYSNHDHDKKGMAETRTLAEVRKAQRAPTQMQHRQYLRRIVATGYLDRCRLGNSLQRASSGPDTG